MELPPGPLSVLLPEDLGDVVLAAPTLAALADAGWTLDAPLGPHLSPLAPLLPGSPRGTGTEEAPRGSATPATTLVLAPGLPPIVAARRGGASRIIGYGGPLRSRLLTDPIPPPRRRERARRHQSEDFRELLQALGVALPGSWVPALALPPALQERGRERLGRAGIEPPEHRLVALISGGLWGPAERGRGPEPAGTWPWPRAVELIQALRREVPRVRFVLAAGREDLWPAVRIHEETARHTPLLGPDLDAATLAAVLAHCRLVVGGDADLLQLAAASGAPTVALFGPSAPERRAPRGPGHRWIVAPRGDLRRLTAAAVAEACRQSLEVAGDPAAE